MADAQSSGEMEMKSGPSVGKVIITLVKILFVVLLGTAAGAAAYFGLPELYRGVVQPVRDNTARIQVLEDAGRDQLQSAREYRDETAETISGFEGKLSELTEQVSEFEAELMLSGELISELRTEVFALQAENTDLSRELERMDVLEERVDLLETALLEESTPIQEMRRQIQVVRALELINRIYASIGRENYGIASADLQAALDVMDVLLVSYPEEDRGALDNARANLELAETRLPGQTRQALNELDNAWAELLQFLEPDVEMMSNSEPLPETAED